MDTLDYFSLLYQSWDLYLVSVILTFLVYYIFYKKYFISFLDPFTYACFFSAMAITVPVFLFLIGEISNRLFLSLLATQMAFFLGFRCIKPINLGSFNNVELKIFDYQSVRFSKWLFIVIGLSNILLQLFSYKVFGIPLFAESRLSIYGESGGISNLLKRILEVTSQSHIFLTIFFLYQKEKKVGLSIFTTLSIGFIIIFSVLSGSKGAFVTFGLAFFIYALYALRWGDVRIFSLIKVFIYKFGVVAVILALVVISLAENSSNPFLFILLRIGQSGDVYYMAYPNDIIDKIPKMNWFIALFASPLSLLRIIPREMVPEPMGFFLMKYHNPEVEFKGPNPRMNVFSYVYFGIFTSPIYCFLIGVITSFFRNKLFTLLPNNILGCILYFLLLNCALKLEPDFYFALADFINVICILPFFVFTAYYLSIRNEHE